MQDVRADINIIRKDLSELKAAFNKSQRDYLRQKRQFDVVYFPSTGVFYPGKEKYILVGLPTYYEELIIVNPAFSYNVDLLHELLRRLIISDDFDRNIMRCLIVTSTNNRSKHAPT